MYLMSCETTIGATDGTLVRLWQLSIHIEIDQAYLLHP